MRKDIYCITDEYNNRFYIMANSIEEAIKKYYKLPRGEDDEITIKKVECILKGVFYEW